MGSDLIGKGKSVMFGFFICVFYGVIVAAIIFAALYETVKGILRKVDYYISCNVTPEVPPDVSPDVRFVVRRMKVRMSTKNGIASVDIGAFGVWKNIAKRQVKTAKSLVVEVLKWKEECIDTERSKSVVEVFDIDSLVEGDEK